MFADPTEIPGKASQYEFIGSPSSDQLPEKRFCSTEISIDLGSEGLINQRLRIRLLAWSPLWQNNNHSSRSSRLKKLPASEDTGLFTHHNFSP
jgi:hypothetical protein